MSESTDVKNNEEDNVVVTWKDLVKTLFTCDRNYNLEIL